MAQAENIPENMQREQTMDEILASIRKIIQSHDEEAVASEPAPAPRAARNEPSRHAEPLRPNHASVLLDDDRSNLDTSELQAFRKAMAAGTLEPVLKSKPEVIQPEPAKVEVVQPEIIAEPRPDAALANVPERLISQEPEQKVAAAFDELSTIMARGKEKKLEETTETMLRPMLQEWLDEHLPSIVERLVREEIERIARGNI